MAAAPAQKAHLAARGGKPPGRQPGGGTPRTRAAARLPGPRPPLRSETLKPEKMELSLPFLWMRDTRQRCPVRSECQEQRRRQPGREAGRQASSRFGGRCRWQNLRLLLSRSGGGGGGAVSAEPNLRETSLPAACVRNKQGKSVNVESDDDATFVST